MNGDHTFRADSQAGEAGGGEKFGSACRCVSAEEEHNSDRISRGLEESEGGQRFGERVFRRILAKDFSSK